MMILVVVVLGLLSVGVVLVVYGTVVKNRWGINLEAVSCPRCSTPLPKVRKPRSLRQAMWGGSSCPACGAEVDKWGREIVSLAQRHDDSRNRSTREDRWSTVFSWFGNVPVWAWVLGGVLLFLYNLRYDSGGFVLDGIILLSLLIWLLLRPRKQGNQK